LAIVASSILVAEASPTIAASASCFLVVSASAAAFSCASRTDSSAWTEAALCCKAAPATAVH
jgi:hypothetical protein